ncbi:MAG: LemA family protein [Planctomycetes bacterium]|nr:LemA family protein [Planctomycetota bacterium]
MCIAPLIAVGDWSWLAIGVAVAAAAAVFWTIAIYNNLVGLRVRCDNAWSDIDVQLKRRHDLIPNVVEAVKGYAGYEKGTLQAVVEARSNALKATGPAAQAQAENQLGSTLKSLFALAESYPQLRASEQFTHLQQSLAGIEDAVQNSRRYYNAVVRDLNTAVAMFPGNIVAGYGGFRPREFFELSDAGDRDVPSVKMDLT